MPLNLKVGNSILWTHQRKHELKKERGREKRFRPRTPLGQLPPPTPSSPLLRPQPSRRIPASLSICSSAPPVKAQVVDAALKMTCCPCYSPVTRNTICEAPSAKLLFCPSRRIVAAALGWPDKAPASQVQGKSKKDYFWKKNVQSRSRTWFILEMILCFFPLQMTNWGAHQISIEIANRLIRLR